MSQTAPSVPYWHVWTDADGVSRQSRREMTDFEMKTFAPPAAPQWLGPKAAGEATVTVTVLPPGWTGEWHENPRPQWVVPLAGRWRVETMDGQRVEMGPGELSLGEDQGTRGGRGHFSATVGEEPAVLLLIQRDHPWSAEFAR